MTLPEVPLSLWGQIMGFMKWACKEQNAEAIVSLTVVDGEWVPVVWHQQVQGPLHVKFNQYDDKNIEQYGHLEGALELVHCTIHSHNKIGAHQSGDDADDELSKRGWHITVGKCDKDTMDFHGRYNFKQNAQFDETGKVIKPAYQAFLEIDSQVVIGVEHEDLIGYEHEFLKIAMHKPRPFPDEWKERHTKLAYTSSKKGKGMQSQGTLNLPDMEDDEYDPIMVPHEAYAFRHIV